jgi:hypothetical protein
MNTSVDSVKPLSRTSAIGHACHRLSVDARELQERHKRQACLEDGRDVAKQAQVLGRDSLRADRPLALLTVPSDIPDT